MPKLKVSIATNDVYHHHHHEIKVVRSCGDKSGIMDPPNLSVACSKLVLQGLFELGYDKFKSADQEAKSRFRVLERQEDLLVVLPTSGRKTPPVVFLAGYG